MLKLYKHIDGRLHYHEAWTTDESVIEHWGAVGEQGETRKHAYDTRSQAEEDAILAVLKKPIENGFTPFEPENEVTLLVEYAVTGMGDDNDLEKRHALEDRLNEVLGWTGLGSVDGGSIGSGTMEVCCYVVDFAIAKQVIEAALSGSEFANFTRIYDEGDA
jgi:predicted DNA-binding WGR domain protein